ncbi:MAG: twin-arginine translocation pathway signal [Rhodobacteraceae bacterium]|nr:twin-arginine translocation pathway signal [Paracoccaceae bacterium]
MKQSSSGLSRRAMVVLGLAGLSLTVACGNDASSTGAQTIDARVNAVLNEMYSEYPNTISLAENSSGMLVMPLVTEAGFGFGGGYGRGALRVNGITVDYYSNTKASAGLQIGAQQYAHVLFFMTDDALMEFRRAPGWTVGADIEYVIINQGDSVNADSNTLRHPVLAVIFAQAGFRLGASLEGGKYTRIIP